MNWLKRLMCGWRGHRWYTCRVPRMPDGQMGVDVCTRCGTVEKVYTA